VPKAGRERVYAKVGGNPKLTLSLIPKRSFAVAFRAAWFLLLATLAVVGTGAILRRGTIGLPVRRVAKAGIVVGLLLAAAAAPPTSWVGLAVFGISTLAAGWSGPDRSS